jgi:glutamate/aspartate transport system ATP-binding protein
MDRGQIIEDCPKDEFFGILAARSDRTRHFFSKDPAH